MIELLFYPTNYECKKFIELGGTIDDIKNLYVQNGGSGVSINTPANNNLMT